MPYTPTRVVTRARTMVRTIVRVKRRREDASAPVIALESDGNDGESNEKMKMRRRAAELAATLDAVLEGGSAATPYGDIDRSHVDVGVARGAVRSAKRRRTCARVAQGVDEAAAMTNDAWRNQGNDASRDSEVRRGGLISEMRGSAECRFLDVVAEARRGGNDVEAESTLMCNYAPMVREYLERSGKGSASDVPAFEGEVTKPSGSEDSAEWVYDVYVMEEDGVTNDIEDGDEGDEGYMPVIRIRDFHDYVGEDDFESDFGDDDDSNAEDYFGVDYPDTESGESDGGFLSRGYRDGDESYGSDDDDFGDVWHH